MMPVTLGETMLAETIRPSLDLDVDISTLPIISVSDDGELVVRDRLGEGGMGVVHLATQRSLGRDVALKVPRDERTAAALVREATTLGWLEHPNIPPVHLLARNEHGVPVLAMKRIEGQSWVDVIAREGLERNVEILEAVCRALHFAHQKGIVHRDVKPDNVMLGPHGEIYLVDWGVAWSGAGSTAVAGTPAYMAPEMAAGETVTPRSDVYLVGATLYEILTGSPPHDGADVSEALSHARSGLLARPIPESAPRQLAAICMRALSKSAHDRQDSTETLRLELVSFRRRLAVQDIASAATERARALASAATVEDARILFREARFGFDQALAREEDDALRSERDAAIVRMAEIELTANNVEIASGLIAELRRVPAELGAALESLRTRLDAENARLHALATQHDPTTGSRGRTSLVIVFAVLWAVISVAIGRNIERAASSNALIGIAVPILAALTVLGLARIVRPERSAVNRTIVAGLFIGCLFMLWSRVFVVYVLHHNVPLAIANDLAGLGAISAVISIAHERRLLFATVAFLVLAIISVFFSQFAPQIIAVAVTLLAINVYFIWRTKR